MSNAIKNCCRKEGGFKKKKQKRANLKCRSYANAGGPTKPVAEFAAEYPYQQAASDVNGKKNTLIAKAQC